MRLPVKETFLTKDRLFLQVEIWRKSFSFLHPFPKLKSLPGPRALMFKAESYLFWFVWIKRNIKKPKLGWQEKETGKESLSSNVVRPAQLMMTLITSLILHAI